MGNMKHRMQLQLASEVNDKASSSELMEEERGEQGHVRSNVKNKVNFYHESKSQSYTGSQQNDP